LGASFGRTHFRNRHAIRTSIAADLAGGRERVAFRVRHILSLQTVKPEWLNAIARYRSGHCRSHASNASYLIF